MDIRRNFIMERVARDWKGAQAKWWNPHPGGV